MFRNWQSSATCEIVELKRCVLKLYENDWE